MPLVHVTSASEFDKMINSNKLTVVDFYADWCGPCKTIAPSLRITCQQDAACAIPESQFEKLANELGGMASGGLASSGGGRVLGTGAPAAAPAQPAHNWDYVALIVGLILMYMWWTSGSQ
ncbi:hypothetical protein BASA62_007686 [Batrachochytrium salamandrivorans]|nr:hypothetical protein BASA62_007686 [Batrachochytrium salamandrivorans]